MGVTQKSNVAVFLGGTLAGLSLAAWLRAERRRSRAEREDPEGTRRVFQELARLLDNLELDGDFEREQDFHDEVVEYLEEESSLEIEVCPRTPHGHPDVLVEDLVAIELKATLTNKVERDRCVGQVSALAKEWLTAVVNFDTPLSHVRALRDALDGAGLEGVPIIDFD
jgi:hypothetical protein